MLAQVVAQPERRVRVPSRTTDRRFRPDVEGLRAIAVLMVVANHAGLPWLAGGYVGVDVFFILSGFLITGLLLKSYDADHRISIVGFYARRVRRILPAASIVLLATTIGSYVYLGASRATHIAGDAQWSSLFASNFNFIRQSTNYLDSQMPPSPLQHFWSLAVEEQFYAVWPLAIIVVACLARRVPLRKKLGAVLCVGIAASLYWSVVQTATNGTEAYFSPLTRAWELGAGALLAVAARSLLRLPRLLGIVLSVGGVAAIVVSGLMFDSTTSFPGFAVVLPAGGAALAVAGGTIAPGGGAEVILRLGVFQWLGKLSYSLYLWHWPLLTIAREYQGTDLALGETLLLCLLALALSAATFVVVEHPVRNSSWLKKRSPLISVGIGVCLIIGSFGTATGLIARLGPEPVMAKVALPAARLPQFPTEAQVIAAVAAGVNVVQLPKQAPRIAMDHDNCEATFTATTSPMCVYGDPKSSHVIVLYGDSHDRMWIPAFNAIGKYLHLKVVQMTKSTCQVADYPTWLASEQRAYPECAAFRSWALQQIKGLHPDMVVLSSMWKTAYMDVNGHPTQKGMAAAWAAGLATMIDRIKPMAGRVIVMGDMAYPNQAGDECLSAHSGNARWCNTPRKQAVYAAHNQMEQSVAQQHGAQYVNTIPWFCTATTCPAVVAGMSTHWDGFHVASNYALWLSNVLAAAVGLS